MAAAGGDLLADHQVEVEVAGGVDLAGAQRAVQPLVIGDRHQVEVGLRLDVLEQRLDRRRSRPSRACAGACRPCRACRRCGASRVRLAGAALIGPERLEGRPPLLGRLADGRLEAWPPGPRSGRPRPGRPGRCAAPPPARRGRRSAPGRCAARAPSSGVAPVRSASVAGPAGRVVGRPNIVTGTPSAVRSRSAISATRSPRRSAASIGRDERGQRHHLHLAAGASGTQEVEELRRIRLLDRRHGAQAVLRR